MEGAYRAPGLVNSFSAVALQPGTNFHVDFLPVGVPASPLRGESAYAPAINTWHRPSVPFLTDAYFSPPSKSLGETCPPSWAAGERSPFHAPSLWRSLDLAPDRPRPPEHGFQPFFIS